MYTSGTIHQTHPVLLCTSQVHYTRLIRYYHVHLRYNTPDSPCIVMYTLGTQYQTNPVLLCSPQIQYTSHTLYYFVHLRWDKTPDSPCIIMYSSDILYQTHPVLFMYSSDNLYQTHPVLLCTPQVRYSRLTPYYNVHLRYNTPDSPCIIFYTSGGTIHQTHPVCTPPIQYILSIFTQV